MWRPAVAILSLALALGAEAPPPVMLWAWEQSLDFQFLQPKDRAGVASLMLTVRFGKGGLREQLRAIPVKVPSGIYRMAVVRLETEKDVVPSAEDWARVQALCLRVVRDTRASALQIDFDAPPRLRAGYLGFLAALRGKLAPGMYLSITALAGACAIPEGQAPWFATGAQDEAVVMLFRMGEGGRAVLRHLAERGNFAAPDCQGAVGYASDETNSPLLHSKRSYYFSPKPWSREVYVQFLQRRSAPSLLR